MAYTTIDNGEEHFNTVTYTGTGSSRSITGLEFGPDWVWIKRRNGAYSHYLYDSTRGTGKQLYAEKTDAEATDNTEVTAFNSDGFSLGSGSGTNENTNTQVAWCWKANGGTTSSNSNGSITSTVQANTTAGFSIVTYTSAAGGQTIGHGLGVKPDMYIIKERTTSGDDWFVYHSALGEGKKLRLSGTSAAESDTNIWQNTAPTTTVAYLQNDGGGVNQNTGGNQNYVGYFFNNVKGYSKMGSYTGNGSTDGTFVYTGFKPAWVMIKSSGSSGDNWVICDNKRDTFNVMENILIPNNANAEFDETSFDFLSNGFKLRQNAATYNDSGDTFIYMAFAEHPFVSSEGVPVTAR